MTGHGPPRSTRLTLLLLVLVLVLSIVTSCGGFSDGGTVGTGRVSSIVGNVVDENGDPTAGMAVSLTEAPDTQTETDAEGNFQLEGEFAGDVTLRFADTRIDATQVLAVPSGTVTALSDVEVSADGVEIEAGRQLGFLGSVVSVDCADAHAIVHDLRGPDARFRVNFTPDTSFARRNDDPATCADLEVNTRVEIDSVFDPSEPESTTAVRVVVGATRKHPPKEPTRTIAFDGLVASVACDRDLVVVADAAGLSRIKLGGRTVITRPGGQEISCADIRAGNQITGLGVLRLDRPGTLLAQTLVVARNARPDLLLLFVGKLGEIDCATGTLHVIKKKRVTTVRTTAETRFVPDGTCEDLRLRDRVRGRGRFDPAAPDVVVATKLRVIAKKNAN